MRTRRNSAHRFVPTDCRETYEEMMLPGTNMFLLFLIWVWNIGVQTEKVPLPINEREKCKRTQIPICTVALPVVLPGHLCIGEGSQKQLNFKKPSFPPWSVCLLLNMLQIINSLYLLKLQVKWQQSYFACAVGTNLYKGICIYFSSIFWLLKISSFLSFPWLTASIFTP